MGLCIVVNTTPQKGANILGIRRSLLLIWIFIIALFVHATDSMAGTYAAVGWMMRLCLITQLLEVLHPMVGYTRGPVFTSLVQVCFR